MRYMVLLLASLFSFTLFASEVSGLNTFQAGEKALASEVNDNFTAVSDAVADNDTRITANATAIQTNSSAVANKMTKNVDTCAPGTAIREIKTDGGVTCEAVGGGGDISSVTAGIGLTGGGDVGDVTLDIDTTQVQKRVTGTCSGGNAVTGINADGTVVCTSNRNIVKFSDGVSTKRNFLISKPLDYTNGDPATVTAIFGGCNGSSVKISFSSTGNSIGFNSNITPLPTIVKQTLKIGSSSIGFYISTVANDTSINDLQYITIGRLGTDVEDICTSDLTFYGIRVDYPLTSGGFYRMFIPAGVSSY